VTSAINRSSGFRLSTWRSFAGSVMAPRRVIVTGTRMLAILPR